VSDWAYAENLVDRFSDRAYAYCGALPLVPAGIAAAKARGREAGSPGLRRRDLALLARMEAGRAQGRLERLLPQADDWLPTVRRLRPQQS